MSSQSITIPIPQRKEPVKNLSYHLGQTIERLRTNRKAQFSLATELGLCQPMLIPALNGMSAMMEMLNLKKLKQMDVSGFSQELIFS